MGPAIALRGLWPRPRYAVILVADPRSQEGPHLLGRGAIGQPLAQAFEGVEWDEGRPRGNGFGRQHPGTHRHTPGV